MLCFIGLAMSAEATDSHPPIRIGMSAPLTGTAAVLGEQFLQGARLVIDQQNNLGGIAGRPLELLVADDGYEPLRTVENTRHFLQQSRVFALFGYIGTPTTTAILPLLRKHQVPFIAAFTGADILRHPSDNFIFNLRASYREEAAVQIRYLIDSLGLNRIALLIQADEFGATLETAFLHELDKRRIKPVAIVRFQRNSLDVSHAVSTLIDAKPQLVLTAGTYQALARTIELAQQKNFRPVYSVVSFSGIRQLQQLLQPPYQVYASMVLPDPFGHGSALVAAYQAALSKQPTIQASDIGLEGFAAATLLVNALQDCRLQLNQQCLLARLPKQKLYDLPLNYSATTNQASQQVYLYRITPGQLISL